MTTGEQGLGTLTEKEKQTLRLIVRGYDAKSIARSLGLSVHTINERLRYARRKVAVSSSREAARLLFEAEGGMVTRDPLSVGYRPIGEAAARAPVHEHAAPMAGAGQASRWPAIVIGVVSMTFVLALLAVTALPHAVPTTPQARGAAEAPPPAAVDPAVDPAVNPVVVDAARRWLALLDRSDWDESYRQTGTAFRALNTASVWADVSNKVRAPLGATISRTLLSQENLPAPPLGYEVVKFRTRFARKAEAVETVTLEREGGDWRVVGITVG